METDNPNPFAASPAEPNTFIEVQTLIPGTLIAQRYRLVRQLGADVVGVSLLVEDLIWGEEIVLKFLHQHVASSSVIMHFIQELREARQLSHPHILQMYDFLLFGSAYALSLEHFAGHSLAEELKQGPLSVRRGVRVAWDVYRGLHRAHRLGLVHQDLTPANILVNYVGGVKIVRQFRAVQPEDGTGYDSDDVIREPRYLAPEYLHRGVLDAPANIYSLGVVMYEMFTGVLPFTSTDPVTLLLQQRAGQIKPPRALRAELPGDLEALILRTLDPEPAARPTTTEDVRRHLLALARQVPLSGEF